MDTLTHTIGDIVTALFGALVEWTIWAAINGWFFIAYTAWIFLNAVRGKPQSRQVTLGAVLLFLVGVGFIWWSHGKAFNPPISGVHDITTYVH